MKCKRCNGSGKEPDWRALGQRVRERREELEMSQAELARRAKCSRAYVSHLEGGITTTRGVTAAKAQRILAVLGIVA